ncbi:MAG: DUF4843 domain-containing protein [Prevotella sp.]|nr:DUF4843 domain-containing protein [Prevotella sp.]MBP3827748.1 DUF4843 domain-containing protein [Prevotella sp.]MBQ7440621.1 DUF4843 domain-containing protein [Prevotella sp.]MBQ9222422.1 DUF4843 domain-containing protein [Prevotella sp.]
MKKIFIFSFLTIVTVLFMTTACENDEYLYQDIDKIWLAGEPTENATADSTFFSFRAYSFQTTDTTLHVIVKLTGHAADHDRKFQLIRVDTLSNVDESAYELGDLTLPAGKFEVSVPVKIKRTVSGLDITERNAELTLRAVPTEDLGTSVEDALDYKIVWCDYLTEPATWSSWSAFKNYIGPFTQARYKFIIDFTGYTEFSMFANNYNLLFWFQGHLNQLLNEYNSNPANAGRPEGWPYLNDNGEPLQFGYGLRY